MRGFLVNSFKIYQRQTGFLRVSKIISRSCAPVGFGPLKKKEKEKKKERKKERKKKRKKEKNDRPVTYSKTAPALASVFFFDVERIIPQCTGILQPTKFSTVDKMVYMAC